MTIETTSDTNDILKMQQTLDDIPQDVLFIILSNLIWRNRCRLARVCKLFHKTVSSFKNNSVKVNWNKNDNARIQISNASARQAPITLPLIDPKRFEDTFQNLIRFGFSHRQSSTSPNLSPLYGKIIDNILNIGTVENGLEIFVNDVIDLNWNINKLKNKNKYDNWESKYEMGVLIKTSMNMDTTLPDKQRGLVNLYHKIGPRNIGFTIGSYKFEYTPGAPGLGAKVRGRPLFPQLYGLSGFPPRISKGLHHFEIFIGRKNPMIYLKIMDGNSVWKTHWELENKNEVWLDKECTRFKCYAFGIRMFRVSHENGATARFGNINIEVGKMDLNTLEVTNGDF